MKRGVTETKMLSSVDHCVVECGTDYAAEICALNRCGFRAWSRQSRKFDFLQKTRTREKIRGGRDIGHSFRSEQKAESFICYSGHKDESKYFVRLTLKREKRTQYPEINLRGLFTANYIISMSTTYKAKKALVFLEFWGKMSFLTKG